MLLAIDIGNSNIVYGLFFNYKWQHQWRTQTTVGQSPRLVQEAIYKQFLEHKLNTEDVKNVIVSSVVPALTTEFIQVMSHIFVKKITLINEKIYTNLPLSILHPKEIGSDLVANAMAGFKRYPGHACTIVDFGTALTYTTVNEQGEIIGVSIAPGLKTAIHSLFSNTAQLPEVALTYPNSVLGMNTDHAIQSGVLIGYTGMVKFVIQQIKSELLSKGISRHFVIATGGLSGVLMPLRDVFDDIDPTLTLDGIRLIGECVDVCKVNV